MTDRQQKACDIFVSGYNCAQAVLMAFAPEIGMDEKTAAKLASSFGGGMARMREVCGAVSAMFMVAGLLKSSGEPSQNAEQYALINELAAEFKAENHSIICRELLEGLDTLPGTAPEPRTAEYYAKRPCARYVMKAVEITEKLL